MSPVPVPALVRELYALAGALPEQHGTVLAERPDGTVVRFGQLVAKAHDPHVEADRLDVRLAVAASERLAPVLLPPAGGRRTGASRSVLLPGGRRASLWPYGTPVDPENPDAAPWEQAGVLLARLHSAPVGPLAARAAQLRTALPPMRGPAKAARALARMRAAVGRPGGARAGAGQDAAADAVERAWSALPAWCRSEEPSPHAATLCHGDFHLGQLVRHPPPHGPWRLIDVDDLGLGDPAWDLARPAAWYACGLLPPAVWDRFLAAYTQEREAAGTGVRGDPWHLLDAPARALTVQTAALAVAKARTAGRALDEAEEACADACVRIAAHPEQPPVQGP